jgi:hypothetical protein
MSLCICGRLGEKYCARCKSQKYCSVDCQKVDWKTHKVVCGPNLPSNTLDIFEFCSSVATIDPIQKASKSIGHQLNRELDKLIKLDSKKDEPIAVVERYHIRRQIEIDIILDYQMFTEEMEIHQYCAYVFFKRGDLFKKLSKSPDRYFIRYLVDISNDPKLRRWFMNPKSLTQQPLDRNGRGNIPTEKELFVSMFPPAEENSVERGKFMTITVIKTKDSIDNMQFRISGGNVIQEHSFSFEPQDPMNLAPSYIFFAYTLHLDFETREITHCKYMADIGGYKRAWYPLDWETLTKIPPLVSLSVGTLSETRGVIENM